MTTPAQRHFLKAMAAKEEAKAKDTNIRPDASQYELMLAQLYEHTRQLKGVESIKAKGALKAKLLPDYEPYVEGVLEADTGLPDEVLMTVMIWRIDAQDWEGALEVAEYAVKHGLALPDKYQRSTVCVIAEEIAEAAKEQDVVPLEVLQRTANLVVGKDMPDQVAAKFHKALGLALEETDPQQALNNLKLALSYNDRVGVKKEITRIEKALTKQSPAPDSGTEE